MTEENYFHQGEQNAQQRWNTVDVWDQARRKQLLWRMIPDEFISRVAAAPFFFLATSNSQGECDCSFKGGGPGLIKILSPQQFAFPDFSGNGAFMSLGNILVNPQVGCLFIDFKDGGRLRINGRASIFEGSKASDLFPLANRVVVVDIEQVVPNCNQHIPRLAPVKDSNEEEV